MKEIWKDITGYEDKYQISNTGKVKSFVGKHKILKLTNNDGYMYVGLNKDKKQKRFRVHRLVAEAFVVNNHNHPIVNHLDGDKSNNNYNNLEWCTQEYNMSHKIELLKRDRKLYESLCDKCRKLLDSI